MGTNQSSKTNNNHVKRLAPLFITILILVVIVLGYWGYCINGERKATDPLSVLYDTILMFKMESYESGIYNWQLVIARYLATLIVGYGAYIIVIDHFSKWWSRLKIILTYRDHTIIAGLGRKGCLLATSLHKAKEQVVVIESDPDSIYIERVRKEGIIVFISDGLEKNCWINAGLLRAKRFILAMDSDDKNIEAARLISELSLRRKENNPLSGLVHMDDLHNFDLLKDYLDVHYGMSKLEMNLFNTSQVSARRIWDLYPPHEAGKENPLGSEIAILIAGYNETAEAFLVENMILSQYKDLVNIRVFIVVRDAEKVEKELMRKYPFLFNYLNYQVIQQTDDFFCNENFIADENYKKLRRVYIFGDEDAEVILRAKKLKQCFYNRNYEKTRDQPGMNRESGFCDDLMKPPPVVVCLPEKTSVVELLNYRPSSLTNEYDSIENESLDKKPFEEKLSDYFNIFLFRQFTDSYNKTWFIDQNEIITIVAKVINYLYSIKYGFKDRFIWLFDAAKIKYTHGSLDDVIKDLENILLTIRLTTNNPLREIENIIFGKIRAEFKLPAYFSLKKLSIDYRWQLLSDRLEDSNLYAARHVCIKLLYPHESDADFRILAQMEHKRWMAEKLAFQFRKGFVPKARPAKNIVKEELKLNNLIIPFETLPQAELEKDYDLFRLLGLVKQIMTILSENQHQI